MLFVVVVGSELVLAWPFIKTLVKTALQSSSSATTFLWILVGFIFTRVLS
jgi:hypothetical protein